MTRLADILDPDALRRLIGDRVIAVREHPTLGYRLYNYTERAQFDRIWTPETLACRGLIADADGRIVARPFAKFFNAAEYGAWLPPLPAEPFEVYDKLDGSLGILYPTPDGHAIATRGAFDSDQAQWATAIYRERYGGVPVPPGQTYLFEIIAPQFRIVVDYGQRRDLVLLAVIDQATGRDLPLPVDWPGSIVARFDGLADLAAISALHRDNAEGFVLRFASGLRVKVKHAEYVRLHRILSGLSTKTVWEHLAAGGDVDALAERAPDEWHTWLRATAAELQGRFDAILADARGAFAALDATDRKAFAHAARQHTHPWLLFALLDGKDYRPALWRQVKPARSVAYRDLADDA